LKNKDEELEAVKSQIGEQVVLLAREAEKTKEEQDYVRLLDTELERVKTKLEEYKLLNTNCVLDELTKDQEIEDFKAETEENDKVIKKLETEIAEYHENLNKKTDECEVLVHKIENSDQLQKINNEKFEEQQRKIDETYQQNNYLQNKLDEKNQEFIDVKKDRSMIRNQAQENNASELHELVSELETQKDNLISEKIILQNKISKLDTDLKKNNTDFTALLEKTMDHQTIITTCKQDCKNAVEKVQTLEKQNYKLEEQTTKADNMFNKLSQEIVALKNQLQDLDKIKKRNENLESEKF